VLRLLVELLADGALPAEDVPAVLHDHDLEAEADPEVRDLVLTAVVGGEDLALHPSEAEASRDDDSVARLDNVPGLVGGVAQLVGLDPAELEVALAPDGGVLEGLDDGEVRVLEPAVLADEGDLALCLELVNAVGHSGPSGDLGRGDGEGELELAGDDVVQVLLDEEEGNVVNVVDIVDRENLVGGHVAEAGDLAARGLLEALRGAAEDDLGGKAEGAGSLTPC